MNRSDLASTAYCVKPFLLCNQKHNKYIHRVNVTMCLNRVCRGLSQCHRFNETLIQVTLKCSLSCAVVDLKWHVSTFLFITGGFCLHLYSFVRERLTVLSTALPNRNNAIWKGELTKGPKIPGWSKFWRPGYGMEVPCEYKFRGMPKTIKLF